MISDCFSENAHVKTFDAQRWKAKACRFGKRRLSQGSSLETQGADSRGERQIKRAKSVRAEAWCERKFTRRAGTAPGRIPLTD